MLLLLCWKTSERKALLVFPGINVRGWNVYGKTERDSGGKPFFSTVGESWESQSFTKITVHVTWKIDQIFFIPSFLFSLPLSDEGLSLCSRFPSFFIVAIFIFLGQSCSGRQHGYVTLLIRPQQCLFYVWSKCVCICLTWWRPYVSQPEEAGSWSLWRPVCVWMP